MASKLGNTFVYTEQYFKSIDQLDEATKYKVNWDLCYYGTHECTWPEDVSPVSKAMITAMEITVEKSTHYGEEQAEKGVKGGRTPQATDEAIKEAIIALYEEKGAIPPEKDILDYLGISTSIRKRDVWKDRNKICSMWGTKKETHATETPKRNIDTFNF